MKFIDYSGKERTIKVGEKSFDSLTQTTILHTVRGTQYEVSQYGAVYRIHPCSGKRIKVGDRS